MYNFILLAYWLVVAIMLKSLSIHKEIQEDVEGLGNLCVDADTVEIWNKFLAWRDMIDVRMLCCQGSSVVNRYRQLDPRI